MHSLNGSWRPERGRPTKRKAHLNLNRENTKRKVNQYIVPEYNNGLVKTQLMKYALTTGEVYPSTSRFFEQQDTVRELSERCKKISNGRNILNIIKLRY